MQRQRGQSGVQALGALGEAAGRAEQRQDTGHRAVAAVDLQHRQVGRPALARPQRVPLGARDEFVAGLEHLRQLVLRRHALHPGARGQRADARRAGRVLDREREVDAGRDAGLELVADGARQLEHRAALGGGAQEALVGDALLVEGQHVGGAGGQASSSAMVGSSLSRVSSRASGRGESTRRGTAARQRQLCSMRARNAGWVPTR